MKTLPRRQALLRALGIVSAAAVAPVIGRTASAAASCVEPSSESLRASLNYKETSPDPAQTCAKCGFFTPQEKAACGPCAIMSGPVHATGHCDSWSAKS